MKPTTYVLDVSKWRCGMDSNNPKNRLGIGRTFLLNGVGYSCCLGQFAAQKLRKKGKSRESANTLIGSLGELISPANLACSLGAIYDPNMVVDRRWSPQDSLTTDPIFGVYYHTDLANDLIKINDDEHTSVRDKLQRIRATLKANGHTLRVINQHYLP